MSRLLWSCPFTVSERVYLLIAIPSAIITMTCWWYVYLETYAR